MKDFDSVISDGMNSEPRRILFIGNLSLGSNALSFLEGFESFDFKISKVDTADVENGFIGFFGRILKKFFPNLYSVCCSHIVNFRVKSRYRKINHDYIFVFKGLYVGSRLLKSVKGIKCHYHPDDSSNPENTTKIFMKAEASYDVHFTSKFHNLDEIRSRTGSEVFFMKYAYDPKLHKNIFSGEINFTESRVGFIGTRREDRLQIVRELSKILKKDLMIAGKKWNREKQIRHHSIVLNPVYGDDYLNFIAEAPVQLGFLNSENRDTHTARTFEIPATGALFILEDSKEHREYFKDMEEVILFQSPNQITSIIKWIRENPEKSNEIARRGYLKVVNGGNTWSDRANFVLSTLESISLSKFGKANEGLISEK